MSATLTPHPHSPLGPVLVTGGTGFLGRHLVERLLALGRTVTVLARRPAPDLEKQGARFVTADLADADAVRSACQGVGTVFHVAAKVGVWGCYDDYFRTNVLGTRAILDGCRAHGVRRLVYTSTPSVVYNGRDLAGADESLPLTTACPAAYPLTKAIAEREVLAASTPELRTVALRPHLIWGADDPHLVPRLLERARSGRLHIVGTGLNRVDMVHVRNAVDAHLLAELAFISPPNPEPKTQNSKPAALPPPAAGRAYFITNGEPVVLWEWINGLLRALGRPPVTKRLSLGVATAVGAACEALWHLLPLRGEPPLTRFVAKELATDHWFDISAARRDLGYRPRVSMAEGTAELVAHLQNTAVL
ncbi:MAG: NAD-dependent epimerase/dehydratase family protein [Opitutaceae bacterium]|nr:NAD-dependent epimerase/dehydratase family protein [Opitutaceae bacterium]